MRIRLTEIRLRPTGKRVRFDRDVNVESLFIGRGPDNDVSLKGLTISLHQATIRKSDGRLYIEAAPGQRVNVNGLVSTGERLQIGDTIRIGSWELRILEPYAGFDASLEYTEVVHVDDERSALDARTRIGVEAGALARRPLSWAAVGLVLVFCLLVPILWAPAQLPWTTGPVSSGHAYIATQCQECHSGFFQGVRNAECATCHYDVGRHAPAKYAVEELEEATCAGCHLEHRGRETLLADEGSRFCAECHAEIDQVVEQTKLAGVSDFGTDHPPFKLTVVTDPHVKPVAVDMAGDVSENSGLDFSHFMHVGDAVEDGSRGEDRYLSCGACHQPDIRGRGMKPVVFEDHCRSCHALDPDPLSTGGALPHGEPEDVRGFLREFYWNQVLNAEVQDPNAPASLRNRKRDAPLSSSASETARAWVDAKTRDAVEGLFGGGGTCRECHTVIEGSARDGGAGITPVQLQRVWAPRIAFSHASHTPFACAKCHGAAAIFEPDSDLARPDWSMEGAVPYGLLDAEGAIEASEEATDILIPGIETCRECHQGAKASGRGVVPSPCSMCHPFHGQDHGPMHVPAASSAETDGGADAPLDEATRTHEALPAAFARAG